MQHAASPSSGAQFGYQLRGGEVALINRVAGTILEHALLHLFERNILTPGCIDHQQAFGNAPRFAEKLRARPHIQVPVEMGGHQNLERSRAERQT